MKTNNSVKDQKIIIYGGSFNPPTIAHAAIIDAVAQDKCYDKIWLLPSKNRSDKKINVPANLRVEMLDALIKECFLNIKSKLMVSDFELAQKGNTMTYKTAKLLNKKYPQNTFVWLIGADSWINMSSWEHGEELRKTVEWLIIPRDGYPINDTLPPNAKLMPNPVFASKVSSTMLRQRIANNQSAMPFTTPAVSKIITSNKLYV